MPTRAGRGSRPPRPSSPSPGRWRRAPPGSSSTCTPPSDGELVVCHDATVDRTTPATGNIASFTLAELRQLDFSYWFIPGADVTPDRPEGEYPYRGRAPDDPQFGIATLREVLEQFPGVVLNLDIKQTAPMVTPYEESLARLLARVRAHRRRDRGLVPRPGHRRLPDVCARRCPPRPGRSPRRSSGGRCTTVRRYPTARSWPTRCPSAWAISSWSTRRSSRPPTAGARRSTCGRSTRRRPWSDWWDLGVDGIISDVPTAARQSPPGREVSPGTGRSALSVGPAAVGS